MVVSTVNGIDVRLDVSNNKYFITDTDGNVVKTWKTITGAARWIEKHWAD